MRAGRRWEAIRFRTAAAVVGGSGLRAAAALGGVFAACGLLQAEDAAFFGRLSFELIEEIALDHKLRLLADFGFHDENGRVWLAPKGSVLDGWSIPRELRALPGLPLEGEYRKSGALHDFYSNARAGRWQDVHRMLYAASLSEGIAPSEARSLYATIYASGWRWEPKESSCYLSCHASTATLAWRPDVTAAELTPVLKWMEKTGAQQLAQIDQRVDVALQRAGPHLFAQIRQEVDPETRNPRTGGTVMGDEAPEIRTPNAPR